MLSLYLKSKLCMHGYPQCGLNANFGPPPHQVAAYTKEKGFMVWADTNIYRGPI